MSQHEQTINFGQETNDSVFRSRPEETRLNVGDDFQMTEGPDSQNRPTVVAAQNKLPFSDMPRAQAVNQASRLSDFENSAGPSGGSAPNSVSPNVNTGFAPGLRAAYTTASTDRPDQRRPVSSESPSQRSEKEDFQDIFSELMTGTEHEIAFLTRHYAEVIGPWYALIQPCPLSVH